MRTAACLLILAVTAAVADEPPHWAFVPPVRPDVPAVEGADAARIRNPIDAFIIARLESEGLRLAPEADRPALLRRVAFDLTGLPPTPEELEAFEKDEAPGAWERVVDRLLASPQYGVRQAQHWLDVARYADSDGYEFDAIRPNAWRYRDWVVDAFNRDLPYDEFVRRQMAGDELSPGDPAGAIATGFHRAYPDMPDMNDQGERRQLALDDITATTGLAFLGLTLGCAKCHDHKWDPIPQADFYRLQAFFTPAAFEDEFSVARLEEIPRNPTARVLRETSPTAPPTFLRKRGDYRSPGPEVRPEFPSAFAARADSRHGEIVPTAHSTGRRTALAGWLTEPGHPLTSRVMVNRLWQRMFGRGIVATPNDFGTMGEPPSHPELLDWLATEFVAKGWSMKGMLRLMAVSSAYRQGIAADPAGAEADPGNALLWQRNRKRLDAEALRDAMLAVSGELNPELGGAGVRPELPDELVRLSGNGPKWPTSPDPGQRNRRSLYIVMQRNQRYPFLETFDRPDANLSCPDRPATTIAPQALSLLNGRLPREAAAKLAERSLALASPRDASAEGRIAALYRLALGRRPDPDEVGLARSFLGDSPADGRWKALALALLNLNEFVYLD